MEPATTRTSSEQVRQANRDAQRTFGGRRPEVPCESCPPAGAVAGAPARELDGALLGRGCKPASAQREQGRLRPRTVADFGLQDGGDLPRLIPVRRYRDPIRPREPLEVPEIQRAIARGYRSETECCKGRREQGAERTIFYVNGISTPPGTHCATLAAVANLTCARVVGVYNATEGMGNDLLQVSQDRELIKQAARGKEVAVGDRRNPAADAMRDLIAASERNPRMLNGRPLEIWAHSQGGAIASLALYDVSHARLRATRPAPLQGVRVTSINAAAPSWVSGPSYEHYVHLGDFVGVRTGIGEHRTRERMVGRDATVVVFGDNRHPGGPRFVWRELRHDERPPTPGHGNPRPSQSSWNPTTTEHHGVDNVGLPMIEQRATALGNPPCPQSAPGAVRPYGKG